MMPESAERNIAACAALMTVLACSGTAPPDPGPPVTIVADGASNPTVAVGPGGGAWIAWVGAESTASDVWISRRLGGGSYAPPVRANDIAGDAAPHEQAPARVAVGPEGNVYVLWQNNTVAEGRMYPFSNLRFARSTDGGRTFEPAVFVNDDAGGPPASHTFHDMVVSSDGTVYVSWIDSRVRAVLEAAPIAGGSGEGGHAGHGDPTMPGPQIRIAKSTDGGVTFGASIVVADNACPCCRTALAVSPDGTLYVSWRTVLPGNIRDVVVARSGDGGETFSAAQRVNEDGWVFDACPHAGSSLAVDGDGRLHVAWYTGAGDRPGIYSAVSGDGGRTFGDPNPVLTGEWVPPSQVKLAAAGGRVAIVWDDRRAGPPETSIAYIDPATGAPMSGAVTFSGASPAIASDAGRTVAAWLDGGAVRVGSIDD